MKRKNQLTEDCLNIKKVRFNRKRCADEYLFYEGQGGASDEDVYEYDRKKRLKITNGIIYTVQRTITKNKNNIPSYIN
jgi:hypothetical protein